MFLLLNPPKMVPIHFSIVSDSVLATVKLSLWRTWSSGYRKHCPQTSLSQSVVTITANFCSHWTERLIFWTIVPPSNLQHVMNESIQAVKSCLRQFRFTAMCQEHQDLSCTIHLMTTEALIAIRWIDNSPKMFSLSVLCSIRNNDSFQWIGLLNQFI